ncbi:P-loop containing nucleoside triphosphate hydrolase protein [Ilyonectria destructans]|nr:P-loop containing nucleoside triphosphate hydrolase protein [Ilyonectria destructans]
MSTRINCVFETPHSCLYLNFAKLHNHCRAVSKPSFPPKPNSIDSPPLLDHHKPKSAHPTVFIDVTEHHIEGPGGWAVEIIPTKHFRPNEQNDAKKISTCKDYTIVLRRTWMQQRHVSSLVRIDLEIQSENLCQALRSIIINSYEDTDLKSYPIKLRAPFKELFFHRKEIKALSEDEDNDPDLPKDAKALHDFVQNNALVSSIVQDHERFSNEGEVLSDVLWTIYPPNSLVVLNAGKLRECWICRDISISTSTGLTRQTITLPMTGMRKRKISDLPLVPIEHYQDWKELKKTLMTRSATLKRVLGTDLLSFSSQTYDGPAWKDEFTEYAVDLKPLQLANQVCLADLLVYSNTSSESESSDDGDPNFDPADTQDIMAFEVFGDSQEIEISPEFSLEGLYGLSEAVKDAFNVSKEEFELLFPALVPAFGLLGKEWQWVLSDQLQEREWNTAAFESLQLKSSTKDLVQSLIKGHKTTSTTSDDAIPDKEQGLTFLLHGKPGLGKTHTAESLADIIERPLYSISGGELKTHAEQLEVRLESIFGLTARWDAVLLLDEADVLLRKRNENETEQDSVLTVFLRKIENFQGVLFLKTNRKQEFDVAFKNRIRVSISYPDLTDEMQSKIWKRLIQTNTDINFDASWNDNVFSALGMLSLNGRMIKSILRTAVAYANASHQELGVHHLFTVLQTEFCEGDDFDGASIPQDEQEKRRKGLKELKGLHDIYSAAH